MVCLRQWPRMVCLVPQNEGIQSGLICLVPQNESIQLGLLGFVPQNGKENPVRSSLTALQNFCLVLQNEGIQSVFTDGIGLSCPSERKYPVGVQWRDWSVLSLRMKVSSRCSLTGLVCLVPQNESIQSVFTDGIGLSCPSEWKYPVGVHWRDWSVLSLRMKVSSRCSLTGLVCLVPQNESIQSGVHWQDCMVCRQQLCCGRKDKLVKILWSHWPSSQLTSSAKLTPYRKELLVITFLRPKSAQIQQPSRYVPGDFCVCNRFPALSRAARVCLPTAKSFWKEQMS